jgi:hypothetical protein
MKYFSHGEALFVNVIAGLCWFSFIFLIFGLCWFSFSLLNILACRSSSPSECYAMIVVGVTRNSV